MPPTLILKNWEAFKDKLPHPQSALVSLIRGQPNIRINQSEWAVWRLIDEKIALTQIAARLSLSIEDVQRIAFRLIFVGLAEEVPMMLSEPATDTSESLFPVDAMEGDQLSPSFFRNLIGFLRQAPKSS